MGELPFDEPETEDEALVLYLTTRPGADGPLQDWDEFLAEIGEDDE